MFLRPTALRALHARFIYCRHFAPEGKRFAVWDTVSRVVAMHGMKRSPMFLTWFNRSVVNLVWSLSRTFCFQWPSTNSMSIRSCFYLRLLIHAFPCGPVSQVRKLYWNYGVEGAFNFCSRMEMLAKLRSSRFCERVRQECCTRLDLSDVTVGAHCLPPCSIKIGPVLTYRCSDFKVLTRIEIDERLSDVWILCASCFVCVEQTHLLVLSFPMYLAPKEQNSYSSNSIYVLILQEHRRLLVLQVISLSLSIQKVLGPLLNLVVLVVRTNDIKIYSLLITQRLTRGYTTLIFLFTDTRKL